MTEPGNISDSFEAQTPKDVAAAAYAAIAATLEFVNKEIQPVLLNQLGLTEREQLVRTLWFRTYLWLKTLAALCERHHLQGIMAAARGLLELVVDLKLVNRDQTTACVEKFTAFAAYQQWKAARLMRDYCNRHPADPQLDYLRQLTQQFPPDPQADAQTNAILKKNWGTDSKGKPVKPETWTGQGVADNCRTAGMEREHREIYWQLCAGVHGGVTGFFNKSPDDLETSVALAYLFALRMVLQAVEIVGKEFKLSHGIPEFRRKMEWVESLPGRYLNHISQSRGSSQS